MTDNANGEGTAIQDVPEPTVDYVKPKFKRGAVALPQEVKIPHVVAKEAGVGRFLLLEKDSEIPKIVLEWLMADARYSGWFTKKQ